MSSVKYVLSGSGLLSSQSPYMKYLTKGCSNHCGLLACSWVKMAESVVQQGSEQGACNHLCNSVEV